MTDRLSSLTSRQRECLRGKWDRKLDKAIAAELGISTRAVEEHLRSARERLGVSSSLEASLIAARDLGWDHTVEPQCGSTELPDPPAPTPDDPPYNVGASVSATGVRDVSWGYRPSNAIPFGKPLRGRGEQNNGLSIAARHTWIIVIAIGIPAATVCVLAMTEYLGRFVRDIARLFS